MATEASSENGTVVSSSPAGTVVNYENDGKVDDGKNSGEEKNDENRIFRIAVGSKNPCKINAVREALVLVIGRHRQRRRSNDDHGDADAAATTSVDDDAVELDIQGYSVPSGVPDQPFGDAETQLGAKNRAQSAYEAYQEKNDGQHPHFAVGLEGGLEWCKPVVVGGNDAGSSEGEGTLWCMAWMAIYSERTNLSVSNFMASEDCKSYPSSDNKGVVGEQQQQQRQLLKPAFGLSKTGSFLLPPALGKLIKEDGLELGEADDKLFGRINSKHGSGTVGILTDGLIDRSDYYVHALILALVPWIRPDVYLFPPIVKSSGIQV